MTAQEIFGIGFSGRPEGERLRAAARELEAVVLTQLFGAMRNTVPEGGLFGESVSNDIFRSMLDSELARQAAQKSPFGLADALVRDFENRIKEPEPEAEAAGKRPAARAAEAPGRSWRI